MSPPAGSSAWSMPRAMAAFVARLRAAGLNIGIGESQDALRAIAALGPAPPSRIRAGLAAVLVRDPADRPVFDTVFERFWLSPIEEPARESAPEDEPNPRRSRQTRRPVGTDDTPARADTARAGDTAEARGAAARGPMPSADYARLDEAEQARVRALARRAGRRLARARLRRARQPGPGPIDWPATLRASLRAGGEITGVVERRVARRRTRLFVFADVSHSMQAYSQLALSFIEALARSFHGVDIVPFADHALAGAGRSQARAGAGGGTRIGESLIQALARPAGQRIDRRTVVLIVSDGWDAGDAALRETTLARLRHRAAGIYWLDPLMDHPDYFASAAGPQHESAHVDQVVPARSLAALADGIAALPRLAD